MKKVYICSSHSGDIFSDWHEVSKEQARRYITFLLYSFTAIPKNKHVEYIEENKLRGITVEQLLGEKRQI